MRFETYLWAVILSSIIVTTCFSGLIIVNMVEAEPGHKWGPFQKRLTWEFSEPYAHIDGSWDVMIFEASFGTLLVDGERGYRWVTTNDTTLGEGYRVRCMENGQLKTMEFASRSLGILDSDRLILEKKTVRRMAYRSDGLVYEQYMSTIHGWQDLGTPFNPYIVFTIYIPVGEVV